MQNLPFYVHATFIATVIAAYLLIAKASNFKIPFIIVIAIWSVIQSIVALTGFYTPSASNLPRFPLLVLPPMLFIVYTMTTKKGKLFLQSFDLKSLIIFHSIRVPVELVLYWLFVYKTIPGLMTFEGRNFDILSGLSAPVIYYLAFIKNQLGTKVLITWNVICLALVMNVVVHSVLSSPTPFQQFAFDQPNIGLLYFPFVLLPTFLVPAVILSHVSAIQQLLNKSVL